MVWKPHTTVAAIIERDKKFLMVEEFINDERVFNQPAGHLDPNESLIDAVIRETLEETAWNFTPEAITGIYLWKHPDNGESFLRVTFCGAVDNHQQQLALDDGIIQAVWMSHNELIQAQQQLRSPMVINCIDDYLAGKRFPMDMLVNVTS